MATFDPDDRRFKKQPVAAPPSGYGGQVQETHPQQYADYPQTPVQYHGPPADQHARQGYGTSGNPGQYQNIAQQHHHAAPQYYQAQQHVQPAPQHNQAQQPYGVNGTGKPGAISPAAKPSQGPTGVSVARPTGWSTGLFDCFSHADSTCIMTLFCPCMTYGQNYEMVTGKTGSSGMQCCGYCCLVSFLPILAIVLGCNMRTKLRQKYNLEEDPCHDFIVHWCCTYCALCQENRECHFRDQQGHSGNTAYQKPPSQHMTA